MENNLIVLEAPALGGTYIGRVYALGGVLRAEVLRERGSHLEVVTKRSRFPTVDAAYAWLREQPALGQHARLAA
ncbi:hypothetical protein HNQ59_002790 [Chitinivorax tropicus]|uniref:Uncharacterized protein n=1 Tax=Chitinivorax tropicus TaxID=714531 RepID=A0A840MLH1_9PROT|nr:hypothetical protein [Chitinivorax tropicus]MBB5019488.1 hypothetical protein [Chitinivorax tropicus]